MIEEVSMVDNLLIEETIRKALDKIPYEDRIKILKNLVGSHTDDFESGEDRRSEIVPSPMEDEYFLYY